MQSRQRRYTEAERDQAVRLAGQVGPRAAAQQLGIPFGTVRYWMWKERSRGDGREGRQTGVQAARGEAGGGHGGHLGGLGTGAGPVVASQGRRLDGGEQEEAGRDGGWPGGWARLRQQAGWSQEASQGREGGRRQAGGTGRPGQAGAGGSRRVARVYSPSQRAQAVELAAEVGVSEAARRLGISRWSITQWRRKVGQAAAGQGSSPTAGPEPAELEARRDREILGMWHRHPGLGPSQIRNQLRRQGIKVGLHTVRRVMEEAGYRPPKVKRHEHNERYEAVRPNHLWHLDFVHRHINRASTFTLILLDDYSRFVVGWGVDEAERAELVVKTFEEAVARHGKPEAVMHDKGSAFWSWKGISRFTALLTELGVDQVVCEHKEWNGKLEVFNANLAKELFDVQRFYDLGEMKRRLAAYFHWYNHHRTHHALGGLLVPADRYYGRVDEVLARIEAGQGANLHTDLLALDRRPLELFKVVSRGGKPEVWLLGHKVWSAQ